MNNTLKKIIISVAIFMAVIAGYFIGRSVIGNWPVTFRSSTSKIEFSYPSRYALKEMEASDAGAALAQVLALTRNENIFKLRNSVVEGDSQPVITVRIFNNLNKQSPRKWADTFINYSNISPASGDIPEVVIGGAKALLYTTGGKSDNAVIVAGNLVYVFTGMFSDENSSIRTDLRSVLDSVRFAGN